jgi:hypothetical protein
MTYHKPHWTKRQVQSLNKAIREGATIAFTLTGPDGEPCNGGTSLPEGYARPGLVQKYECPLGLCQPGVFHATLEPHKWNGSRVWIVALYGKVECEANTYKLGALKREFIGEVLAHEAMDPRIGIKLGRKDLAGADLRYANLYKVNLSEASLYMADFSGAYLYMANLSEASLNKASLYRADLGGANLSGADLGDARLSWANLNGANLGNWERGPDGYARRKS